MTSLMLPGGLVEAGSVCGGLFDPTSKMVAIIQSTKTPGTITVTASSGSLSSGSATITTLP